MKLDTIKKYREHHGLHYSLLKNIIDNNVTKFQGNIHADIGSALDARISLSESEFFELYKIGEEDRPTGKLADIIDKVFKRFSYYNPIEGNINNYLDKIIEAAQKDKYGGKRKTVDKIKSEVLEFSDWWDILVDKQHFEFITQSELKYIDEAVNKIKNNIPGKYLFELNPQFQVDIYTTLKIRENEYVDVKGLIDMLIILDNKIMLIDLKHTSYSLDNWHDVAKKNKYHIQMALYYDILQTIYPNLPIECYWLTVGKKFDIRLFPVHESDIRIGRDGARTMSDLTYDSTDEKLIKEVYHMGYKDAICKYLDAKNLELEDYNVEKHRYNGIFPKKSIFE